MSCCMSNDILHEVQLRYSNLAESEYKCCQAWSRQVSILVCVSANQLLIAKRPRELAPLVSLPGCLSLLPPAVILDPDNSLHL